MIINLHLLIEIRNGISRMFTFNIFVPFSLSKRMSIRKLAFRLFWDLMTPWWILRFNASTEYKLLFPACKLPLSSPCMANGPEGTKFWSRTISVRSRPMAIICRNDRARLVDGSTSGQLNFSTVQHAWNTWYQTILNVMRNDPSMK